MISRIQQNIHCQPLHGKTGWFPYFWFLFRAVINRKRNYYYLKKQFYLSIHHAIIIANGVINFTLATRLIIAAWCLMGIVFVNSYTSSLLSHLLAPTFLPVISTVQDLADSHIVQITSLKHTSADSALLVFDIIIIMIVINNPQLFYLAIGFDRRQRPVRLPNLAQVSELTPRTFWKRWTTLKISCFISRKLSLT